MDGHGILDPRQSFDTIQGSCSIILRRILTNVSNPDRGIEDNAWNRTVYRTQPREERERRMQMMRDIIRDKTPWVHKSRMEPTNPNGKPIKQNEEVEDYFSTDGKPDLITYSICVLQKWLPYKIKKKECCPCNLNETLTFTENRRISGKKIESGKKSAVACLKQ